MRPFPWRRRVKPSPELEHARQARKRAEEQLARDLEHVIIPLREIRQANHVGPLINALIQRRVERGT